VLRQQNSSGWHVASTGTGHATCACCTVIRHTSRVAWRPKTLAARTSALCPVSRIRYRCPESYEVGASVGPLSAARRSRDCEKQANAEENVKTITAAGKGGVGKTTTCASLADCLAERGYRVLLTDLDPMANLTTSLGLDIPEQPLQAAPVAVAWGVGGAVHVARSAPSLKDATRTQIDRWLDSHSGYDVRIIDSPPHGVGSILLSAMVRSDAIIVTTQPAVNELPIIWEVLDAAERMRGEPTVAVLLNRVQARRSITARFRAAIDENAPGLRLSIEIPEDARASEWADVELPLTRSAPRSRAAEALRGLAIHVEDVLGLARHTARGAA
jgi:cellulose biosynthesis protein BcsQ